MAIIKPPQSSGNGTSKFLGTLPICIWEFKDRSGEYDWADLYLSVEVKVEGSEYNRNVEIKGSFEKDAGGNITGGSVLNRLYKFFDAIGCKAGINAQGKWEDDSGNEISDIASYCNERYVTGNPIMEAKYNHVGYVYKKAPRKPGGKAYTEVHYRIFPNDTKGKEDLTSHVNWMKTQGYLKEWSDTPQESVSLAGAGAENL